jgi:hypothetical protein
MMTASRFFAGVSLLLLVTISARGAAQVTPTKPYEFRITGVVGSAPAPPGTSCGWCGSGLVTLTVSRRVTGSVDVVAGFSRSSGLPDSLQMVGYEYESNPAASARRRSYRTTFVSAEAFTTSDLRARFSAGTQRRLEMSAGAGLAHPPEKMPYVVITADVRIGNQHLIRLGLEHRSYWIRYNDDIEQIIDGKSVTTIVGSGRSRAATLGLSVSIGGAF